MGNTTSTQNTVAKYNGWMRVQIALEIHVKSALLRVFHNDDNDHNYIGFSRNETTLYTEMCKFKHANSTKLIKVINGKQWDILCPASHKTDTSKMDTTLLCSVIRNLIQPPPLNGWKLPIKVTDKTKASYCLKARELRNMLKHGCMNDLVMEGQFQSCWNKLEDILVGLNYDDLAAFNDLKDGPLDRHTSFIISTLEKKISSVEIEDAKRKTELYTLKTEVSALNTEISNQKDLTERDVERLSDLLKYLKVDTIGAIDKRLHETEKRFDAIDERLHMLMEIDSMKDSKKIPTLDEGSKELTSVGYNLDGPSVKPITGSDFPHYTMTADGFGYVCHHSGSSDDPHVCLDDFISEPPTTISISYLSNQDMTCVMTPENLSEKFVEHFEESFPGSVASIHHDETNSVDAHEPPITAKICGVMNSPNPEIAHFVNVIKGWLRNENSCSLIVTGYSCEEHCKFVGRKIKTPSSGNHETDNNRRILVFNQTENTIINIRISTATEIEDIQRENEQCKTDLKLISALNYKWLKESGIILIGLVFLLGIDKESLKNFQSQNLLICAKCTVLLVPKEDTSSEMKFRTWWENTHSKRIENLKAHSMRTVPTKDVNAMKRITSDVYGFMSTVSVNLPQFSSSPGEKISKIMLNLEQHYALQFIHSKRRVFLRGTFGSGKSIVAGEVLKQIARSAEVRTNIFYLCGESHSLLNTKMFCESRNLMAELKNKAHVNIVSKSMLQFSIENNIKNSLVDIIIYIIQHTPLGEEAHIIIDEFDNEKLSVKDAETLRSFFTDTDLKSIILVIVNPLQKLRQIEHDRNGVDNTGIGRNFHLTGFRQKFLNKVMRSTLDIAALYRIAKDVIEKHPSKFAITDVEKNPSSPVISERIVSYPTQMISDDLDEVDVSTSLDTTNDEQISLERKPDLDNVFKVVTHQHPPLTSSRNLISQFKIAGGSQVGHSIHGPVPYIIYTDKSLLDSSIKEENTYLLSQILQNIKVNTGWIITCTNKLEFDLFSTALTLLGRNYAVHVPTIDKSKQMELETLDISLLENNIIITDYVGSRGLECNELVVCVSSDEYYLKHFIVESFTRCRSALYFIVTSNTSTHLTDKENVFKCILSEWEEKRLVRTISASINEENYCVYTPEDDKFRSSEIRDEWFDMYREYTSDQLIHNYDELSMMVIGNISSITSTFECFDSNSRHTSENSESSLISQKVLEDIQDSIGKSYYGNVTMKITSYSRMRKEAPRAMYSHVFYSSPFGYKLCVRVYGTLAHIFASIQILKGEHDDYLSWPFSMNYKIIILHPFDESKNITKVVMVTELPDYCNEKPIWEANRTRSPCITSYEKVRYKSIALDDTIYIRCVLLQ